MKTAITIFLVLIVFLQTFSRFVVEADFFLNKSYIAKALCVNKDKPKMHCNGHCYLAKQLKEQDKQDQQVPQTKKAKIEVQLFNVSESIVIGSYRQGGQQLPLHACMMLLSSFPHSVFRPPSV